MGIDTTNYPKYPLPVPTPLPGLGRVLGGDKKKDADNVDQGTLSGQTPAGELYYDGAVLEGIDWDAVTNDMAMAPNLSVSVAQIMTLLIEVMSQMRQDQREAALLDAQNALESGLAAADEMKKAAWSALAGAITTGVVNAGMAGFSMVSAGSQIKQTQAAQTKFDTAMNKANPKGAGLDAGDATKTAEARSQAQAEARQALDVDMQNIRSKAMLDQGVEQFGQAIGGMGGAVANFFAQTQQANAKALEAQAGYEQSIAQADQAFFQQLGDSIKSLLQAWQGVESATHHASESIYNV